MNIELKPDFPITGYGPCSQYARVRTPDTVVTLRARRTDAGWEVKVHEAQWAPVQAPTGALALLLAASQLPDVVEVRY
ncbi:hypothetical protein [Deinococcus ficus]|uniref:Uncharacterized protein n=1 Tax=Deinococcus ficus TaxID=317577 RepID=A0A221T2Y4_9DEIO|nr:hypothetical protein [Deinococcus ficus]ASN83264.1 hypothetical protein DFI_18880 [Deinococcus ficus]